MFSRAHAVVLGEASEGGSTLTLTNESLFDDDEHPPQILY